MNWLRRFMMGRYGGDQLSNALLIISLILLIILQIIGVPFLFLIAYIPIVLCLFRMFSRNIAARQRENMKFLNIWRPVSEWFKLRFRMIKEIKTYKYFKCPKCKQRLRIPRGKGKVEITCRKCSNTFTAKS